MSDISVESFELFAEEGELREFLCKIHMKYNGESCSITVGNESIDNRIINKELIKAIGFICSVMYGAVQGIDTSTENGKQSKELAEYLHENFVFEDKEVMGHYGFENITASLNGEDVEGVTIEPWEEQ